MTWSGESDPVTQRERELIAAIQKIAGEFRNEAEQARSVDLPYDSRHYMAMGVGVAEMLRRLEARMKARLV